MQPIDFGAVVSLAVLVLDVDQIVLADAKPLERDIGVAIGKAAPVDSVLVRIGVIGRLALDDLRQRRRHPVRALEESREAGVIARHKQRLRLSNSGFKGALRRGVGRERFAFLDAERAQLIIARSQEIQGSAWTTRSSSAKKLASYLIVESKSLSLTSMKTVSGGLSICESG